jgi:alpha-tubulin suppressor-like RCC1 family protein
LFGKDVVEAAKLLTRAKEADEAEYVNNILKNHLAAVVKNADKINNLMDCVHSGDNLWAKRYLKKSQRYYQSKFSKALDKTILDVGNSLCMANPKRKDILYTQEEMSLYVERDAENYTYRKKLYEEQTEFSDFSKDCVQYWWEELLKFNFCITEDGKVWGLGKSGWYPLKHNPIRESEYGEYLYQRTRKEVDKFIEEKKKKNYFYDFVDLEKL